MHATKLVALDKSRPGLYIDVSLGVCTLPPSPLSRNPARKFFGGGVPACVLPVTRCHWFGPFLPLVPDSPVHSAAEDAIEFVPPFGRLLLRHHVTEHSVQGLR